VVVDNLQRGRRPILEFRAGTKLFDFGYANVPRKYLAEGIKDWADLAKVHGLETIEKYLINKNIL
jgi:hypothetical protein